MRQVEISPAAGTSAYRSDIDGLRAVAVTLVLVYHAFPTALTGGYVGVDVFFVISGFLITGLIQDQTAAGTFRIADFYQRRIRRIFPALIVVLAASFAAGWLCLLPDEFEQLGINIFASSAFAANIALLLQSGYFDVEAVKKPLLHLWSLGIEEQFYIVWPLLLIIATRYRNAAGRITLALGLASFVANLVLVQGHREAAFYLPFTRAWELLAGAALAIPKIRSHRWSHWTSALGMALIIGASIALHAKSTFPGWRAGLPVAGCALLIASPDGWLNRRILGSTALVAIGLISYPLYLWHWPALVFAGVTFDGLGAGGRAAVLILSVVLAAATYALIEKPIRFGGHGTAKTVGLVVMMLAVAGLGLWACEGAGLSWRLPAEIRAIMDVSTEAAQWRVHQCMLLPGETEFGDCVDRDRPLLLVWGDSTVGSLMPGLRDLQRRRHFGLAQFSISSCEPLLSGPVEQRCIDINGKVLDKIASVRPDIVLLEAAWFPSPDHVDALLETVRKLKALGIRRVLVMGRPPVWYGGLKYKMLHHYRRNFGEVADKLPQPMDDKLLDNLIRERVQSLGDGVGFISLIDAFCQDALCTVRVPSADGGMKITTSDGLHLTEAGSIFLASKIQDDVMPRR